MFGGVAACAPGVAGFLTIVRLSGGRSDVSLAAAVPLAAGLAAVLAGCLGVARGTIPRGPLALALARGVGDVRAGFAAKSSPAWPAFPPTTSSSSSRAGPARPRPRYWPRSPAPFG
jgi:hypothetical protein